jgi:hypothetical protein
VLFQIHLLVQVEQAQLHQLQEHLKHLQVAVEVDLKVQTLELEAQEVVVVGEQVLLTTQ